MCQDPNFCEHLNRVPKILSDDSIVQDCAGCDEPLIQVDGKWVTVAESAAL